MYTPKYTISNAILKNIGIIEACREVIENAPLIPAYEKRFREDALIRTVHHGTHIEGNFLSFEQARKVVREAKGETNAQKFLEGEGLAARDRDVQEVINYRRVMDYLDELFEKEKEKEFEYTEKTVQDIHKLTVHRLIAPEVQGKYRESQVVLRDSRTGEITFRPPPGVEVPYLMDDFILWLNSKSGREAHPVLRAGIAHYDLAAIHPFVEGNGRTARAFATLILFLEGYDIKQLFSLEEYFDKDAQAYYDILIKTSNASPRLEERDLTSWLEYFTQGLSFELTRIKDRIRRLSVDLKIKAKRGGQVALSERQIKIVEYLSEHERGRMPQFVHLFPDYSDDTVLRDLQDLTKKGIIKKKGKTKGAYYELVT